MRMVGCVSPPTSGELRVLGMDPAVDGPAIRARLGVVPAGGQPRHRADRARQPAHLRALLRPARGRDPSTGAEELLEFMQLTERRNDLVDPLSGGMKRRLTIGRALDQPARPAPARRAHHRARPAGAPPPVGALLPTEAAGRDHGAHDALHGRGRAALRPARDHGRRPHRHRGFAARAGRAARDA